MNSIAELVTNLIERVTKIESVLKIFNSSLKPLEHLSTVKTVGNNGFKAGSEVMFNPRFVNYVKIRGKEAQFVLRNDKSFTVELTLDEVADVLDINESERAELVIKTPVFVAVVNPDSVGLHVKGTKTFEFFSGSPLIINN